MLLDLRAALHASQREDPLLPPLAGLLKAFADAGSSAERLDRWIALQDWTREGAHVHTSGNDDGAQLGSGDTVRLRLLLHALETCSPVRLSMQNGVGALFVEADACSLLAEAGMPSDRGFLGEASARLWAKVLPEPCDTSDLRQFLRRCYHNRALITRFQRWPPELFHRIVEVVMPPSDCQTWSTLRRSVTDAVHLLCARIESQGLAPKLRSRSRTVPVVESPFFLLARAADGLIAAWYNPATNSAPEGASAAAEAWSAALAACRAEVVEIDSQIRSEGISVDIVFSLDVLDRCLARLELLGSILLCPTGRERSALIQRLLTRLVLHLHESRSLRNLATTNLRLLHRRIVEHSGETGEHYIARDRSEYYHLLLAAAGGGVLTVGTTALKLLASELPGSDFAHGLIYGINYAVSFLMLHHLHLVLATKQPAMTAATLATILREQSGSGRIDEIVDRITRISHSQLAAAAGNVVMVALGALAFTTLWQQTFGQAFLDEETARKTYASFSPFATGTVFFAALTGVILWSSSVIGGWIDNWSAWHRIDRGIADHPLGRSLGRDRMVRWGKTWRHHIGAWGSNISLGLMLGLVPAFGHFFGLPLDVRHVTLSTGMLFTACGSLAEGWYSSSWFLSAIAGISTMFVLNLGVSFSLSLWTALRALEVPAADVRELLHRLARRLLTRPFDFILPPKAPMQGRDL
jgi:site-specific recombinase